MTRRLIVWMALAAMALAPMLQAQTPHHKHDEQTPQAERPSPTGELGPACRTWARTRSR